VQTNREYCLKTRRYFKVNKKKILFTRKLDLQLRKKLVKCYVWSIALYSAETSTLRKVPWENILKVSKCVLEKDVEDQLDRSCEKMRKYYKESRSVLHTVKRGKADCIGQMLGRNCLLKHVIEGKIEGTGRR
jgi:hypothetical protein